MGHRITKSFTFDAAHWLPQVPETHKCRRLHGHTYRVEVALEGPLDPEMGWVEDYGRIKAACAPLIEQLDHSCLNDTEGLENPTAERLAEWLFDRLQSQLPALSEITVCETPSTQAIYHP